MLNFDGIIEYKNYAAIDLGALKHNFRVVRECAERNSGRASRVICVVKADAYGHGVERCVPALLSEGADFFAVSSIDEALEVRSLSRTCEILILGYTPPKNAPLLARYDIIQCVHCLDYARALEDAIENDATVSCDTDREEKVRVHVKLDTGMNRIGFCCTDKDIDNSARDILKMRSLTHLSVEGLFTHFASADMPKSPLTEKQLSLFVRMRDRLRGEGMELFTHASNSASLIRFGDLGCDAVRAGIVLYGLNPSSEVSLPGLRPVMSLYSRVSELHTVRAGESVSYGATYSPSRDERVATISIGYADGLIRACGGGYVTIGGRQCPVIGRICMDQCIVRIDDDAEVREGDQVIVYGENDSNLEAFARCAGTIDYELICLVGHRVPRVYTENGVKLYYRGKKLSDL